MDLRTVTKNAVLLAALIWTSTRKLLRQGKEMYGETWRRMMEKRHLKRKILKKQIL